jgi:hypothetical protein
MTYAVSAFPHVMTHQLHDYVAPSETYPYGTTTSWGGTTNDADADVETFIDLLADIYPDVALFGGIFFYTMATPTAQPLLVKAKNINVAGTDADGIGAGDEYANVQKTFNFLTDEGTKFRMQLMDTWARGEWNRINALAGLSVAEQALITYLLGDDNIFAARSDARPTVWRATTATFNEKLRKARRYG